MDIDATDVNNELAVVEYVEDIYTFYKIAEVNIFLVLFTNLKMYIELTVTIFFLMLHRMRAEFMITWIHSLR